MHLEYLMNWLYKQTSHRISQSLPPCNDQQNVHFAQDLKLLAMQMQDPRESPVPFYLFHPTKIVGFLHQI